MALLPLKSLQTSARFGSASGPGVATAFNLFAQPTVSVTNMGGFERVLYYNYDVSGRRRQRVYPGGGFLDYDYAPGGRLVAIRQDGGAAPIASFSYDAAGRRGGTAVSGAASSFGYDALSRLSSLGHDLAGTAFDQALGFGYNPASQIVTRTSANDAFAWTAAANAAAATPSTASTSTPPPPAPCRRQDLPFLARCLSRSRTMLASPSGSKPRRRATS